MAHLNKDQNKIQELIRNAEIDDQVRVTRSATQGLDPTTKHRVLHSPLITGRHLRSTSLVVDSTGINAPSVDVPSVHTSSISTPVYSELSGVQEERTDQELFRSLDQTVRPNVSSENRERIQGVSSRGSRGVLESLVRGLPVNNPRIVTPEELDSMVNLGVARGMSTFTSATRVASSIWTTK